MIGMIKRSINGRIVMASCLVALSMVCNITFAQSVSVIYNPPSSNAARANYPLDILRLALAYDRTTDYDLQPLPEEVNKQRLLSMIQEGQASVIWAGTKPELESTLRPIRIPIFKGLLGHRIFIVRRGDQARFSQIDSLGELINTMVAGQGRFWGDTPILENAGLRVEKPVGYPNLFDMLDGERFDFFPRAIHEPWQEVAKRGHLNLAIETDLMLVYPMPLYFFTSRDNESLAQAIEAGLNKALDDGSFDKAFMENPDIRDAIDRTNVANRRLFRISNPALSAETPLDDPRLWFDVKKWTASHTASNN